MTIARAPLPTTVPNAPATASAAAPVGRLHRQRDFGVGYGSSSGYASARRYADTRGQPHFRCF